MKYRSTRGGEDNVSFTDVVLNGLASDGGLYVPKEMPCCDEETIHQFSALPYRELAFHIFRRFIDLDEIDTPNLRTLVDTAYVSFRHQEVVRLVPFFNDKQGCTDLNQNDNIMAGHELTWMKNAYILELFHGPTFAFKDVAMQFLGQLFQYFLAKRKSNVLVLGATSGDTGSAAIAALKGLCNVECVILFPEGRTSDTQRLQMTTTAGTNIHCVSVQGTFDDCQTIVKGCFNDLKLKDELRLAAVNSINFARIMSQMTYYWYAAFRVIEREGMKLSSSTKVDFIVPTGNFGNILAGHYAKAMGAPIGKLIIATNPNDLLRRFHSSGVYDLRSVIPTSSPSMDIQISSNFERFLYEASDFDDSCVKHKYDELSALKSYSVTSDLLQRTQQAFEAYTASEDETLKILKLTKEQTGHLIDPHTAVGVSAMKQHRGRTSDTPTENRHLTPCVCLATAHFGKFSETVERVLETKVSALSNFPVELMELQLKEERFTTMPPNKETVSQFLRELHSAKLSSPK